MSFENFGTGYRPELEDHANLMATSSPFVMTQTYSTPKSISHRAWRKPPKNQGSVGACSGFSRSSGEEILNYIATGGAVKRFSEMYAYLENQIACSLIGSDQGATIDGSVKAAGLTGICSQELFPYPGRYVTTIPAPAIEEGKQHLIRSHAVMQSYDDCLKWLASGVGVILIGVPWTSALSNAGKTIEANAANGRANGGHALVWEGYDGDVVDSSGRPYIDMENSWGPSWGDGGWSLVSPDCVQYWIDSGSAVIGISDLQSYGPRKIPSFLGMTG